MHGMKLVPTVKIFFIRLTKSTRLHLRTSLFQSFLDPLPKKSFLEPATALLQHRFGHFTRVTDQASSNNLSCDSSSILQVLNLTT